VLKSRLLDSQILDNPADVCSWGFSGNGTSCLTVSCVLVDLEEVAERELAPYSDNWVDPNLDNELLDPNLDNERLDPDVDDERLDPYPDEILDPCPEEILDPYPND